MADLFTLSITEPGLVYHKGFALAYFYFLDLIDFELLTKSLNETFFMLNL